MPAIIHGMGYDMSKSQILTAIPYASGLITALVTAFGSDVLARRSIFVIGAFLSIIVGLTVIIGHVYSENVNSIAIIMGMCFIMGGTFPIIPTGGSWVSNNIVSSSRRAVGLAFVMSVGSLGGLTGSFIYIEAQAPHFYLGYNMSCGFACLGLALALVLMVSYWKENQRRQRLDHDNIQAAYSEKELHEMGEANPLFRFTL
jgi:MFS family permease